MLIYKSIHAISKKHVCFLMVDSRQSIKIDTAKQEMYIYGHTKEEG